VSPPDARPRAQPFIGRTADYNVRVLGRSHVRLLLPVFFGTLFFTTSSYAQGSRPDTAGAEPAGKQGHKASLNWAPSPDAKKHGAKLKYAVYRSGGTRKPDGTAQCAGKYAKIAEVEDSKTTFTDHTVKANHVYCYQLRSVIGKTDGPPSTTVISIIPADK